jgi:hypothetical protein
MWPNCGPFTATDERKQECLGGTYDAYVPLLASICLDRIV